MNYIYIAIASWLLLGIVALIEKNLVDGGIKNPNVLAFYSGFFAIFLILIFLPSAHFISWQHFWFDILCGVIFFCGVWAYFTALKYGDVTEILTLSGALTPIFSLGLAHYILHLSFTPREILAFVLLLAGIIMISFRRVRSNKVILFATISAIFLALYYSLVKNAYTPFSENFAFVRLGSFLTAILLLLYPATRREAFAFVHNKKVSSGAFSTLGLFVGKEVIAGGSFITLNYAISIGNPAIVNALQGSEYAFVFIAAALLTLFWSNSFKEDLSRSAVIRKSLAVALIFVGIVVLNY